MIKIGTLRNLLSIKILEKYYKGNNLMLTRKQPESLL